MDLRTAKSLSPREYHARRAASRRGPRRSGRVGRRSMDEGHLVLDRRIRKDLEILEQLWEELAVGGFLSFLETLDS